MVHVDPAPSVVGHVEVVKSPDTAVVSEKSVVPVFFTVTSCVSFDTVVTTTGLANTMDVGVTVILAAGPVEPLTDGAWSVSPSIRIVIPPSSISVAESADG